jgi:predicted NAD/FAD-binding protein
MRIAVVGSGIAGLVAALRLQADHQVDLLEAADYAGGHTHTHTIRLQGQTLAVDSGFIVFNRTTYPQFSALLDELGIACQPTDMSFSVRCERTGLEYAGSGLAGLLAQPANLLRPAFWQLGLDWVRFHRQVRRLLPQMDERQTVGAFFAEHRYSAAFREWYFLPLGSAVWSCPRSAFEGFPIKLVLEFYRQHGMLGLPGSVRWRVIQGGSRRYVEAIVSRLHRGIELRTPVVGLRRRGGFIELALADQPPRTYDHVVLACHSDQALQILGPAATPTEREILSAFPYQRNTALLHTDTSVLPRSRRAWASWNYLLPATQRAAATVTYDMTRLQSLPVAERLLVTLNADERIDPRKVLRRMVYHHPVFDARRAAMQRRHRELIDHQGVSYCGAYWGHGFHEDGVRSALAVAEVLAPRTASGGAAWPNAVPVCA